MDGEIEIRKLGRDTINDQIDVIGSFGSEIGRVECLKRWENKQYHPIFNYTKLFNDYWVRPDNSYRPQTADNIEEGCYW